MWDFGTKEWNEYYHGRNNRISRVTERAKRFRAAVKSDKKYLDFITREHEQQESFEAFESALDQVSRRIKRIPTNQEALNRVFAACGV